MPLNNSSAARLFFEKIKSSGSPVTFLKSLVNANPPQSETEWLDFKGAAKPEDIERIWARGLSGFANTEGGVLVWGIDARKNADGSTLHVDCHSFTILML